MFGSHIRAKRGKGGAEKRRGKIKNRDGKTATPGEAGEYQNVLVCFRVKPFTSALIISVS